MGDRMCFFLLFVMVLASEIFVAPVCAAPRMSAGELEKTLEQMAEQLEAGVATHTSVAVLEFEGLGNSRPEFTRYAAEVLSTTLVQRGKFKVVERRRLALVLDELKLNATALFDPETRKQFGRVLGVQAILLGSYQNFSTTIRINTRLIATETGNPLSAASATISKNGDVRKLLGEPAPGSILVRTENGTKVFHDGVFKGTVRQGMFRLSDVEPGVHQIDLRKRGKRPASKMLAVEDSEDAVITLAMRRKPGPEAMFYSMIFPGAGSVYLGRSMFGGGGAKYVPMTLSTVALSAYLGAWWGERELVKKGEYRWASRMHQWKPYLLYTGVGMAAADVIYCFFAGTVSSMTANLPGDSAPRLAVNLYPEGTWMASMAFSF